MLSSIVPCYSSLCGCLSSCSFISMSFVFTNIMSLFSIISSPASVGDVKSITSLVVVGLCFGLIACINCAQALYSGVFSVNHISCIRDFRLGESCVDFSGGESISNCFFPVALAICIVLIGMGLPSAVAKVACRFLVDFLLRWCVLLILSLW